MSFPNTSTQILPTRSGIGVPFSGRTVPTSSGPMIPGTGGPDAMKFVTLDDLYVHKGPPAAPSQLQIPAARPDISHVSPRPIALPDATAVLPPHVIHPPPPVPAPNPIPAPAPAPALSGGAGEPNMNINALLANLGQMFQRLLQFMQQLLGFGGAGSGTAPVQTLPNSHSPGSC